MPTVARLLQRLGDEERHRPLLVRLAALPSQSFDEPIELIVLQVAFGQLFDDPEPTFQIVGLLEGPPKQFNRLAVVEALSQGIGQDHQPFGFAGIGPH